VRGVILWTLGALLAFLATAGAFLLLANSGGGAVASDPIPQAKPSGSSDPVPTLVLGLPEGQLETLQRSPGQKLALEVENGGDEEIPSVDLSLDVVSENTAQPHKRSYEQAVERLAPGDTTSVEFEIDLSPPAEELKSNPGSASQNREILEARASTPEGASAVKTAILAP
jgi:hypothetical protein